MNHEHEDKVVQDVNSDMIRATSNNIEGFEKLVCCISKLNSFKK